MSEIEHYIGVNLAADGDHEEDPKRLIDILRSRPYVDYAVLMANGPEEDKPEPTRAELSIMGRELALIDKLTKQLAKYSESMGGHAVTETAQRRRGESFEVMIHVDGEPTGHIARVTVELDRFDRDLVEAYQREQGER